jgi:chromosome segregation ATPase
MGRSVYRDNEADEGRIDGEQFELEKKRIGKEIENLVKVYEEKIRLKD